MEGKTEFKIELGTSWNYFSRLLRETAPEVTRTFRGTQLEDSVGQYYQESMPRRFETPMGFLTRNALKSYSTPSEHHYARILSLAILGRIGWYAGKIPLVRKIIRLNGFSTELYLGQKTRGYISNRNSEKGEGFGNDHISFVISNFEPPLGLNFDVGFHDARNYFYQINVLDNCLMPVGEAVRDILLRSKNGI